jgi:organic hydroperoxide reductase OsmC/OhrA
MTTPVQEFSISVEQVDGFEFRVKLDKPHYAEIAVDEPPPLGQDHAPNAARLLAAAIANCLTASLLFCMTRAKAPPAGIRAEAKVTIVRNENKRLRIGTVEVVIHPVSPLDAGVLEKCLGTFEDFCTVTQSVREGFEVKVRVEPVAA